MKSNAATVADYLASLPADRRAALEVVREVILKNLDKDYEECMVWGVAAYAVPHRVWPQGHHTDPAKPLMMAGFSSQKNDMVVYFMPAHTDPAMRQWLQDTWATTGKKLGLRQEAGGCCIRFRKLEDIALDVIGEAIRRTPARTYLDNHLRTLASRGRAPDANTPQKKKTAKKAAKKPTSKPAARPAKKPGPLKKRSAR